jgi:aryl-alcohol dehydrogenase-like predicted oxidoreductase
VQNPYSLLNRRIEEEMFGFVRAHSLGLMAYSPLAVGLLSGVYVPGRPAPTGTHWARSGRDVYESIMQRQAGRVVNTLLESANEVGKTPAQLALAWVLSHSEVTVAIMGGDTMEHLEENVGALGWELDGSVRTRLDGVSSALALELDT